MSYYLGVLIFFLGFSIFSCYLCIHVPMDIHLFPNNNKTTICILFWKFSFAYAEQLFKICTIYIYRSYCENSIFAQLQVSFLIKMS